MEKKNYKETDSKLRNASAAAAHWSAEENNQKTKNNGDDDPPQSYAAWILTMTQV